MKIKWKRKECICRGGKKKDFIYIGFFSVEQYIVNMYWGVCFDNVDKCKQWFGFVRTLTRVQCASGDEFHNACFQYNRQKMQGKLRDGYRISGFGICKRSLSLDFFFFFSLMSPLTIILYTASFIFYGESILIHHLINFFFIYFKSTFEINLKILLKLIL